MEIKDKTIALLIDSDNISRDYFAIISDELSQYGKVTYRRLYGNFSNPKANGWAPVLSEYSIEQIQQPAFAAGKNATDSKMIIDAMDILYGGKVDCFCLATSDSDFTTLAMRLRNDNIVVIGAGEKKTPPSFRRACDIFIPIDELLAASKTTAAQAKQNGKTASKKAEDNIADKINKLIKTCVQIVNEGAGPDGWMHFAAFMNELRRLENDFNPKLYGFSNSRPIMFFKSLTKSGKKVFILEKKTNADKIRLNNN